MTRSHWQVRTYETQSGARPVDDWIRDKRKVPSRDKAVILQMTDLNVLIEEVLADDAQARAEYERLEPRFELAGALVSLRQARGLTQAQLAKLAGTSQSAIAMIEGGQRDPSFRTVKKLFKALHADLEVVDIESRRLLTAAG